MTAHVVLPSSRAGCDFEWAWTKDVGTRGRGQRILIPRGENAISRAVMLPLQRLCACALSIIISCYEEWGQEAGEENNSPQNHWSCKNRTWFLAADVRRTCL